jgi:hypothetical protein
MNILDGARLPVIAGGTKTGIGDLRTYSFHLNFVCMADDIERAIDCFQENSHLFYMPNEKKGAKPAGRTCPLLSIEVWLSPNEKVAPFEAEQGTE